MEIELNTERRAKKREEFDTRFKLEQAELEHLRQMRDGNQKREELEEVARLPKEAVHKANPVRCYKPLKLTSLVVNTRPASSSAELQLPFFCSAGS
jgi:targeting protein for Xklp2